jgi:hypothetical protein
MTPRPAECRDEGGDAPCWAHLFETPEPLNDADVNDEVRARDPVSKAKTA